EKICERVERAREIQQSRFAELSIISNSEMSSDQIKTFCELDDQCKDLLRSAVSALKLSARGYHRIIKIARTIADLAGIEKINSMHIAEAIQYRFKTE
ncbi:MAG: hypothetical protein ACD_67C00055G0001, partial [uncultured bacterium]